MSLSLGLGMRPSLGLGMSLGLGLGMRPGEALSVLPPSFLPDSPMDQEPTADEFFTGQGSPAAVHRLLAGVCVCVCGCTG